MGILRRLRERRQDDRPAGALPARGLPAWALDGAWRTTWEAPRNWVHGESHYAPAISAFCGKPRAQGYLVPVDVHLYREPDNPYDANAVRALVHGRQVGHLSVEIVAEVATAMDSAGVVRVVVPGVARGGSRDMPSIGVHIWLHRGDFPLKLKSRSGRISWPLSPARVIRPDVSARRGLARGQSWPRTLAPPTSEATFDRDRREADRLAQRPVSPVQVRVAETVAF